ncbi:hypothetical protein KIPB_008510, partial [Kipferlia bialata]|eukprot:g8510.t1
MYIKSVLVVACLLMAVLCAEKVVFDDIMADTTTKVVLFYDSGMEDGAQAIFEEQELKHEEVPFLLVDKQNDKNSDLFANDVFAELPQLFVLIEEEHMADIMRMPYTADNGPTLIKYYEDWCSHCKEFNPQYAKIATLLKAEYPEMRFLAVKCSENRRMCDARAIEGFPTVEFAKDTKFTRFAGVRDVTGVMGWVKE